MLWIFLFPFVFGDRLSQEENAKLQSMCGQRVTPVEKRFQRVRFMANIKREEAPWVVHMRFGGIPSPAIDKFIRPHMKNVLCSGTLISSRHILTVPSCFYSTSYECKIKNETNNKNDTTKQVLDLNTTFDQYFLNQMLVIKSGHCTTHYCEHEESFATKIKKVFIPSEYFIAGCFYEIYYPEEEYIVVIELEKDVTFSDTVQPACLPKSRPIVNDNFTTYGFDRDSERTSSVLSKCESTVDKCSLSLTIDLNMACSNNPSGWGCHKARGSGQIVFENDTAIVSAVLVRSAPSSYRGFAQGRNDNLSVVVFEHSDWICEATGICRGTTKERVDLDEKWSLTKALNPELSNVEKPPKFITIEKVTEGDPHA